jgi:uncharacterized repeat protein (TIGR01451 family)
MTVGLILLAAPAGAKRPNKPPKPPAGLVDISIEADLWAVNTPWEFNTAGEVLTVGDVLTYTFTVTNRSNNELRDVAVRDALTGFDETITLAAGEVWSTEPTVYNVQPSDMELPELVNTLTVTVGDLEESATATTPVWATEACEWVEIEDPDDPQKVVFELGTIQTEYGPCRWTADPGYWTLTVTPTRTKPTRVQVTVRDHYPGNWCVAPVPDSEPVEFIEPSGVLNERIRGEASLPVFFPTSGTCLQGGAGGEEMPVGTWGAYYLVAMGDMTLTMTQGLVG